MKIFKQSLFLIALLSTQTIFAKDLVVAMRLVDEKGVGKEVGNIRVISSKYGLVFSPELKGLSTGLHGFHVHENASCETQIKDGKAVPAGAAGAHLDPQKTNRHSTPWGDGHLGDLPALYIAPDGSATQAVLAPRLKLADLKGRSLMLHVGGDNHADHPAPLGGGGTRMVCGVVK
jgi:superoxide dismutase, Cu-Zn family